MDWKELLKQGVLSLLGIIVPVLYSAFIGKFPDFPLTMDNVLALFVWIVSLLFSGAKLTRVSYGYKVYKATKK